MVIINDKDGKFLGSYTTLTKAILAHEDSGMTKSSYFYIVKRLKLKGLNNPLKYKNFQIIRTKPNPNIKEEIIIDPDTDDVDI